MVHRHAPLKLPLPTCLRLPPAPFQALSALTTPILLLLALPHAGCIIALLRAGTVSREGLGAVCGAGVDMFEGRLCQGDALLPSPRHRRRQQQKQPSAGAVVAAPQTPANRMLASFVSFAAEHPREAVAWDLYT